MNSKEKALGKVGKYPGWRTMSSSSRYNAKLHRIFDDAREFEHKRVSEGHEPNPNLTSREEAEKHGWEHYKHKVNGHEYSRFRKINK